MSTRELSWSETDQLYKLSLIPTMAVFLLIFVYFNFLMYTDPLKSLWDFIIRVGWLLTLMPITFFMAFEIFSSRKIKEPLDLHLRRLLTRTLLLLASVLSLFGFLIATNYLFYPIIGDWSGIVGSVLWVIAFALVVLKFRELFAQLDKGQVDHI